MTHEELWEIAIAKAEATTGRNSAYWAGVATGIRWGNLLAKGQFNWIARELTYKIKNDPNELDDSPCPKCGSLTMSLGRGTMACQTCPWEENKEEA